jgi:hypothetical protein
MYTPRCKIHTVYVRHRAQGGALGPTPAGDCVVTDENELVLEDARTAVVA